MNDTFNYYNQNAQTFIEGTINSDMTDVQQKFTKYLPPKAHILDAGCGSGRDSLAFLQGGFVVTAIDGSEELCKYASTLIGQPVRHQYFEAIDEASIYDGIWACATLLHVPSDTIEQVMTNLVTALKSGGYMYVSFKYGDFEGLRNGRYFTDYTRERLDALLGKYQHLETVDTWITADVRPDRSDEKWINRIVKKQ